MSTRYQFLILPHTGSLPGIPGSHGPGTFVIDWQERTLHEASSLEEYVQSLVSAQADEEPTEPDASVASPDGQEAARQEEAAITPATPEIPAVPAVAMPETDVALPAQPDEGMNAPDSDAPMAVGGTEQTESIASEGAQA